MRRVFIALTLLASTAAFAQTDKTQQEKLEQQVRARLERLENLSCPVGFTAQLQGSPVTMWTVSQEDEHKAADKLDKLKALNSGIHVQFSAPEKSIQQVDVSVFMLEPGLRKVPVGTSQFVESSGPPQQIRQRFSLTAGNSASTHLAGDLLLGPATIDHIHLTHITYSDGTGWTAPNSSSCNIQPSLYMPVIAK